MNTRELIELFIEKTCKKDLPKIKYYYDDYDNCYHIYYEILQSEGRAYFESMMKERKEELIKVMNELIKEVFHNNNKFNVIIKS